MALRRTYPWTIRGSRGCGQAGLRAARAGLALAALSFTITTRNFARWVWLAFSETTWTSSGLS